jgi:transcriptional regulator with XRE-family HTH domain
MSPRSKAFAQRLRELREAANLSQSDLARRSGVSRPTLSKLEGGEQEPTWEMVSRLAGALSVKVTVFETDDARTLSPTRLLEAARAYGRAYDQLEQKSRDGAAGSVELFARFQEAQVELNLAALDLFAAQFETTAPLKPPGRARRP